VCSVDELGFGYLVRAHLIANVDEAVALVPGQHRNRRRIDPVVDECLETVPVTRRVVEFDNRDEPLGDGIPQRSTPPSC
jgi:hypothetical protein